jgi:hypothetical protein
MSQSHPVVQFVNQVNTDSQLQAALRAVRVGDFRAVQGLAARFGYSFTREDLKAALEGGFIRSFPFALEDALGAPYLWKM